MKIRETSIQKCGIKIFQIAVFVFAFYLIQTNANAQVALGKQNRISSVFSEKCIMAVNGVNGEQLVQRGCQENNEPFFFQFAGGDSFEIKIKGTGKCLGVQADATGNGTPVVIWDCNGKPSQRWTTQPIGEGYQIRSVQSGKCLDVRGPSKVDGTPIQIWECGTAATKQMLYKITDIDIINESSTSPTSDTGGGGGGLTLQQINGIGDATGTIIDTVSGDGAFDSGIIGFIGIAGKFFGASAGLIDIILEVTKQDTPNFEEKTLTKLDKIMSKMDGLEASQKRQFDELKTFLNGKDAYRNLFKGNNVIDSQYSLWLANKKVKSKTQARVIPEYKPADEIINEVSAIGNLCSGESGDTPIYDAIVEANKKSYYALPKFHLLISSKFTKAGAFGAYQRGSANYLQYLKDHIAAAKNLTSTGVENQIVEIRKNEIQFGSNIATEQLRDSFIQKAKIQFANEMAPHRSKCENALKNAITEYSAVSTVKENAKSIVEEEFFKEDTIAPDKLSLLLTDSNPDLYSTGRGFGTQTKLDGSFDLSLAGGRFTAAIGKRLETSFPGYGFVVAAYTQYDLMPTIRSNVTNRCSEATPMPFGGKDAIVKSDRDPLIWKNIIVDGPERICSGRADKYNFNLIVSGFKRETLAGDAQSLLNSQAGLTSSTFFLPNRNPLFDNLKPSVISVFTASPAVANGRRVDPVYFLYPSKFSDLVRYPLTVGSFFYVVSPTPF